MTLTSLRPAYEARAPYIAGNPFIPHWPTDKQWAFLALGIDAQKGITEPEVFEALYGGAVGGGKSDALLMAVAQYAWKFPEFSAVCFRRTFQDLTNPGALLDRAKEWWIPAGVDWNAGMSRFTFPSGAKVKMGHMSQPDAHLDHQGAEYHLTVWDELTQHPTKKQYEYVGLSRVRRNVGSVIPLRTLSGSNPDGPGHVWVKHRFITGYNDVETGERIEPHRFIPATLDDNPFLDRDPYIRTLMHLHPTLRAQLLHGDWEARTPGDYFRSIWFGPLLDPVEDRVTKKVTIRWWDLAASESDDAARTASCKMSRFLGGARAVEHAIAFRATPGARDARIAQIAKADGSSVIQGFEVEPGSGGPAQVYTLEKLMRSINRRSTSARPKVDASKLESKHVVIQPQHERGKLGRASPVASCLERGHSRRGECEDIGEPWWGADVGRSIEQEKDGLRCYAGEWVIPYFDEIEGFPGAALMDFADATSGAWAYLEAHPFGLRVPSRESKTVQPAELQNIHPADRPDDGEEFGGEKTRGGLWRP